jgi:hypothetical protein
MTLLNCMPSICKPVVTTAFGIVTLENVPFFVPFNGSEAPFFDFQPGPVVKRAPPPPNFGVTNAQRNAMLKAWADGNPILFDNAEVMFKIFQPARVQRRRRDATTKDRQVRYKEWRSIKYIPFLISLIDLTRVLSVLSREFKTQ